ncbi:MAG TPA: BACON domain-containing carbohydrate-binding protein, partial [Polyangiales bacterium]|nr:BACON domain-containing carbohydrate-binding protein [Polyangiales bacterium]
MLGQTLVVTQASGCIVSVTPSQTLGAAMGTGTVAVDTEPGCTWTASSATVWLSDVTASGSGDGTIEFDYGANLGAERSGEIVVASSTSSSTTEHELLQGDGCVALLSADDVTVGADESTGTVTLTLSASDCAWSLSSSEAWLTADPASGTTSAAISYTVGSNVSVARNATLTIAGQTFSVEQESGCAIQLQPSSETAGMEMGTLSLDLETDSACAWTAAESSDWFSTASTSGTGPATVVLDVDENVGPAREADIVFTATASDATATYSAMQSDGCTAMLASDEITVGAAGEAASIALTLSDQSCAWTATADSFISLVESSGDGDALVAFDIAANDGPPRTGTITIAG